MDRRAEVWLRGPVEGVPAGVQPVAHALLQAGEEVRELLDGFPADLLWRRPAGVGSVGFHLRHLSGVVDRLFTYARGNALSERQVATLRVEPDAAPDTSLSELLAIFESTVERAIDQLRSTGDAELDEPRAVGRARLPSTVRGLLFHAAEHTQRHVGQLLVTARVLRAAAERGIDL
jgi:uncharacterized damage-inducible protein DinB